MQQQNERISVAGVGERDVDLLMLEEFVADPRFAPWFVAESLTADVPVKTVVGARRSVTHSVGESDLEITLSTEDDRLVRILIENKIGAAFQPRQAERYRERGEAYLKQGACTAFYSVLVAPERYFGDQGDAKGFDGRLSYEALAAWFRDREHLGARRFYKAYLLEAAIEKAARGYQARADAPVTSFWAAYWRTALENAPQLEMKDPGGRASGGTFVHFRPSVLPQNVEIYHKLVLGNVDLQLRGLAPRLADVRERLEPYLEPDMKIAKAGRTTAVVRLRVPFVKPALDFEPQLPQVLDGQRAAARLATWAATHRRVIEQLFEASA